MSAYLVIGLRVLCGLACGVMLPTIQSLMGKWAPKYERSKLIAVSFSGIMLGPVLMFGVGGLFCKWKSFDGGWPSMFYVGGAVCLLFCIPWAFLVYDSPAEHPRISARERIYIESHLPAANNKVGRVPWAAMLKSPAVWSVFVGNFCGDVGNFFLITKLPAFMKEVLKFDVRLIGLFSSLPFIGMLATGILAAHTMDKLRSQGKISTRNARRLSMALAFLPAAVLLLVLGQIPCTLRYWGVICLIPMVSVAGFYVSGFMVNPQDLAPQYAGEIFGISNAIGTIPGMVGPVLVNALTPQGTQREWQIVFYIWAAVFVFGAAFYWIFSSGELQDWAKADNQDETTADGKPAIAEEGKQLYE